jgi:hypothetical protein
VRTSGSLTRRRRLETSGPGDQFLERRGLLEPGGCGGGEDRGDLVAEETGIFEAGPAIAAPGEVSFDSISGRSLLVA